MTEHEAEASEPIQHLGEEIVNFSVEVVRYRDFIARKRARQLLEEKALLSGVDSDDAVFEELMGTGIATGIGLGQQGTVSPVDVDEHVIRLVDQFPDSLPDSFISSLDVLTQTMILEGISFQDSMVNGGNQTIDKWTEEFHLLQALDPQHTNWIE